MAYTKYRNVGNAKNTDTIDPELLAQVRAYLSIRYERRLGHKLAGRQPVNLKIIPSTKGTSEESVNTYITLQGDQVKGAIGDIFMRSNGRLLLLGSPGSGKTTLVLQLGLYLLERQGLNMPVLLNLASWRSAFKTLDEWLSEILPVELGTSSPFAQKIRNNIPLILLLDGLDEVEESDRAACLIAIGEYGSNSQHQFLISSRIEEYSATKDAPVNAQIEVSQLTIEQVKMALAATAHLQPESSRLLSALKADDLLCKVVENPFYLNTAQLLFASGKNWSEFGFVASNVICRQQEILDCFIHNALDGKPVRYPADKSTLWLSFLASRMTERNMVVFELRDLQYGWWKWRRWQLIFARVIYGIVISLVIVPIIGLLFGLAAVLQKGGLFFGVVVFIITIISFTSMATLSIVMFGMGQVIRIPPIETKESFVWPWKNFIKYVRTNLIFGLTFGLAGVLFDMISNGLILGVDSTLVFWLALGFLFSLSHGFGRALGEFIQDSRDLLQITEPFQRFNVSKRALWFCILQHKHLCFLLRRKNLVPSNLVQFLNEMSIRHILEFDGDPVTGTGGGSWRFRHRILQEYFAEKWVEPEQEIKK